VITAPFWTVVAVHEGRGLIRPVAAPTNWARAERIAESERLRLSNALNGIELLVVQCASAVLGARSE